MKPLFPPVKKLLFLFLPLLLLAVANARFVPTFSFEELMQRCDLVLIIEHESTRETDARDEARSGVGRLTTAKVRSVLKGAHGEGRITIRHFYYQPNPNAPNSIVFPPEATNIPLSRDKKIAYLQGPWCYLAFLKRNHDGTYVPVVDAYDSALSFISLVDSAVIAHLCGAFPKPPSTGP